MTLRSRGSTLLWQDDLPPDRPGSRQGTMLARSVSAMRPIAETAVPRSPNPCYRPLFPQHRSANVFSTPPSHAMTAAIAKQQVRYYRGRPRHYRVWRFYRGRHTSRRAGRKGRGRHVTDGANRVCVCFYFLRWHLWLP